MVRWGRCTFDEALPLVARLLYGADSDTKITELSETDLRIEDSQEPFINLIEKLPDGPRVWQYRLWNIGGTQPEAFNALSISVIGYVLLQPTLATDEVKSFVQARLEAKPA